MKTPFLLICMLVLAFAACKNVTPPSNGNTGNTDENPVSEQPATSMCKAPKVGEMPESDRLMAVEASIVDNCLVVKATYSGGCQEHEFNLYWGELWAESMPPQTQLYLHHNGNGDNCRAIKTEEVKFDLSTVQYPGVGEVVLHFNWEGAEERTSINYRY